MSHNQRQVADLLTAAVELGWTRHDRQDRNGTTAVLTAPAPFAGVSIIVSGAEGSNPPGGMLRGWVRKVWRYADPVKKAAFIGTSDLSDLLDLARIEQRRTDRPAVDYGAPAPAPRERHRRSEPEPPTPETDDDDVTEATTALAEITSLAADIAAGPVPPTPVLPEVRVVVERPWLAHSGARSRGGRRYPSRVVRERTWSDGHVDYVCALAGCDWSHGQPQNVAHHYGRAAGHPVTDTADAQRHRVIDPAYTEAINPAPADRRVRRWADRLHRALDEVKLTGDLDADAVRLAERLVEQLPAGGDATGEPLTAEEVLDRVRALVDRGEYLRLRSELTETCGRVGRLEEELAAAKRVAVEEHRRAAHAVDTMRALRELISEEEEKS